jgi:homoserine O-succinyltransferase/O-acetyltransferase
VFGPDAPATRIALVNNMPDAAFDSTERQFLDLIGSASVAADTPLDIALFTLPGIARRGATRTSIATRYRSLDTLWSDPPDALVVTGTEPHAVQLESEPYWTALAELIVWAELATVSTVLSCLAAHAALFIFDGIERVRLAHKCSGVFANDVAPAHPLVAGLGHRILVPHSRQNDVPAALLDAHGYTTLIVDGDEAGWSVAVKQSRRCLFVLCQGHLEYGTDTLLREYRRDVRRFLAGERSTYPRVPVNYLDPADAARAAALGDSIDAASITGSEARVERGLDYEAMSARLVNTWRPAAERFYANWLRSVAEQAQTRERVGS